MSRPRSAATLARNPRLTGFRCSRTGERVSLPEDGIPGLCDCCDPPGAPLRAVYAPPAPSWPPPAGARLPDLEPWLPVVGLPPGYADDVGGVASVPVPAVAERLGVDLRLVVEGANPSGSFKDRGLAVAVALAALGGAGAVGLPTQGNAGVSAAMFSARLGLGPAEVVMPAAWRGSVYHRTAELFGAHVLFHGRTIADAGGFFRRRFAEELAGGGLVDVSTFREPGRLEGKKTMGIELAASPWQPDAVAYPTGGGTGLVGIDAAYRELRGLGLVAASPPRLYAVQSAGCAPVVRAWERGDPDVEPVSSDGTLADGLDVPSAIMGHAILHAVRSSGGAAVAVEENDLLGWWRRLGSAGHAVGLETAAAVAGLDRLRRQGRIGGGERVAVLATSGPWAGLDRMREAR